MSLAPEDAGRTLAAGQTDLLCGAEGEKISLASISDIASLLRAEDPTTSAAMGADPAAGAILPSNPQELLRTLLPILVSAFLDTAPTALSPSSALGASSTIGTLSSQSYSSASSASSGDVALDTVSAVTGIARDLWRAILSSNTASSGGTSADLRKGLEKYVTHMAAYFPFGADEIGTRRTGAQLKKLQDLNIAYCELVALLYLAATATSTKGNTATSLPGPKSASAQLASSKLVLQLDSVQRYVSALLSHSANPLASIGTPSVSQNLNPHAYAQLLPTIWSLLLAESGSRSQEGRGDIFVTMVRHSISLSAGSGTKKLATGFMSRILMVCGFHFGLEWLKADLLFLPADARHAQLRRRLLPAASAEAETRDLGPAGRVAPLASSISMGARKQRYYNKPGEPVVCVSPRDKRRAG